MQDNFIKSTSVKLEKISRVGVVLRPSTPELKDMFFHIKQIFESNGIEVMIDNISGGMIGVLGQGFNTMCDQCDILVTVGGDGTLISAVRRSYAKHRPVLGLHAGKLGFLADVSVDELEDFVQKLKEGNYRVDKRAMLEATITTKAGETSVIAFNDIVLTRPSIAKMIHL